MNLTPAQRRLLVQCLTQQLEPHEGRTMYQANKLALNIVNWLEQFTAPPREFE